MNKLFNFTTIAMTGLIAISGCTKTHHDVPVNAGSMTAVAAGKTINAADCIESSTGNFYVIYGSWGSLSQIAINIKTHNAIPTNLATTTYVFDSAREYNSADYIPSGIGFPAKSGSVTITDISQASIVGSFSFVLADGTPVNGTFNAARQ
jgi:hypothetical protein